MNFINYFQLLNHIKPGRNQAFDITLRTGADRFASKDLDSVDFDGIMEAAEETDLI